VVSKETHLISTQQPSGSTTSDSGSVIDAVRVKADCWCVGRNHKLHKVGDPFCHFPVTYAIPEAEKVTSLVVTPSLEQFTRTPVTFDEDLLCSCINRAIHKTPSDFVTMIEDGKVSHIQARRINAELRAMGYCISEEPF
jgi:hypothetical protein